MAQIETVTLFCEDAREEVSGTVTLVGVLPDNLNVPGVPGMIPKLTAYTRVLVPAQFDLTSLSAFLRLPNGAEEARQDFDPGFLRKTLEDARVKGAPHAGFIVTTVASPFPVPEAMKIFYIVEVNGDEHVSGYLNLALAPTA